MIAITQDYDDDSSPIENWYADSGATVHITNDGTNLINIRECKVNVTVGDGFLVKCEKMGDLKLLIQQDHETIPLLLKNVRLVPDFNCNLFSLTTALAQNNVTITAKGREMTLQKGKWSIKFKDIARNNNGFMLGVKATREKVMQDCTLRVNFDVKPTIDMYKTSDPLPKLSKKKKKMVQFQNDPDLIEANAKAPKIEKN